MRSKFPAVISCSAVLLLTGSVSADDTLFSGRNEKAPAGVDQYGQFEGEWACTPTLLQKDGSRKPSEARPHWIWHYVLNGSAVQDIWIPDPAHSPPAAVMGTNLRVYDPDKDQWDMVWTTESLHRFQHFTARMENGEIVMRGNVPAGPLKAHIARITFFNISANHYDWKYEASAPDDGKNWQLATTLSCDRLQPGSAAGDGADNP